MVLVQLPELAINHVEMLVAEEVCHLIDVVLVLEQLQSRQELWSPQLRHCDLATPWTVDFIENTSYHLQKIFHRENISKYLQVVRVGNYFNLQCEHIENGIPWLPSGTRVQDACQQHLGSKAQSLQAQDSFLILEWGRRWTGLRHRDSWWRVSSKLWWVVGVW